MQHKLLKTLSLLGILVICVTAVLGIVPMKASAASTSNGWVIAKSLTVRSKASASSKKLGYLSKGTKVTINKTSGSWYQIQYKNKTGYVSAIYISKTKLNKASYSSKTGTSVVNYALKFVGNPYKWGGSSLTKGADCSGFIMSVYKYFGYSLPHYSYSLRSVGKKVSYANRKAGDIICYNGHVAIYMGNNKIVHANSTRTGIIISNISIKKVVCVRRVIY